MHAYNGIFYLEIEFHMKENRKNAHVGHYEFRCFDLSTTLRNEWRGC